MRPQEKPASGELRLDNRGPPHISHDNSDGWFSNVHRGHWKDVSSPGPKAGLAVESTGCVSSKFTESGRESLPLGRYGRGDEPVGTGEGVDLLLALLIAALST